MCQNAYWQPAPVPQPHIPIIFPRYRTIALCGVLETKKNNSNHQKIVFLTLQWVGISNIIIWQIVIKMGYDGYMSKRQVQKQIDKRDNWYEKP